LQLAREDKVILFVVRSVFYYTADFSNNILIHTFRNKKFLAKMYIDIN